MREDLIRMAREAGLHLATEVNWMPIIGLEYAEKFAALVIANNPPQSFMSWQEGYAAGVAAEREACAKVTGEFAQKWWSIHCASNKHMETTRKAHDDFCALQASIRARGTNHG